MNKTIAHIPASVHDRLLNKSREINTPFNEILQYYGIERFLYRLSKTNHVKHFILKGGLTFYCLSIPLRRPTKDIDLRGYVSNDPEKLLQIITDICLADVANDGLEFDTNSISMQETQIDADRTGIRIKLAAHLGGAKIPMQIDIGFSDVITPQILELNYPVLLPTFDIPQIKAYPPETIISEKFHAIIKIGRLNSRLKDYYDIWLLSEVMKFDSIILEDAINKTFTKRNTKIPKERPFVLSQEYGMSSQRIWANFLSKSFDKTVTETGDFALIIEKIWSFLQFPVINYFKEIKTKKTWIPRKGWI
jgi:predicted nucleotidyltransferase component of viral defense system